MRWVAFQDLVDELVVLLGELEGDAGVVLGRVSVLLINLVAMGCEGELGGRTTWRASLAMRGETVNARHCERDAIRTGRMAVLKR